jgi:hypothetical protein
VKAHAQSGLPAQLTAMAALIDKSSFLIIVHHHRRLI